jgi:cytochrome oxidase assembly protein ShyY1
LSTTVWQVARRPRWIAALLLALAIAAGFAALGQWQLQRSFESAAPREEQTEVVVPLEQVSQPQHPVPDSATGQLVTVDAAFVTGDYIVLSDRINHSGPGYWVVGHAVAANGASLAVALGWAPTPDAAAEAVRTLDSSSADEVTLTGRYLPTESPQESDFEKGIRSSMAVPELINLWTDPPDGVYGGYLIADSAPAGLELIDAPAPVTEVSLNLLNVFYAAEWVIFAGFAIFLWYRLVRDAWEEENATVE